MLAKHFTVSVLVLIGSAGEPPGPAVSPAFAFYGDVTMNTTANRYGVPTVVFPHWAHRLQFTCQVCHPSIFRMESGAHEILMERMAARESFCMACHNGRISWKPVNCARCHLIERYPSGNREPGALLQNFSRDAGGNVDWADALRRGLITPRSSLTGNEPERPADPPDVIMSRTEGLPAVIFSHAAHGAWLACKNCHPGLFTPKKAANQTSMAEIWAGQYCGKCHGKVAFPITQCDRCHQGSSSP